MSVLHIAGQCIFLCGLLLGLEGMLGTDNGGEQLIIPATFSLEIRKLLSFHLLGVIFDLRGLRIEMSPGVQRGIESDIGGRYHRIRQHGGSSTQFSCAQVERSLATFGLTQLESCSRGVGLLLLRLTFGTRVDITIKGREPGHLKKGKTLL